MGITLTEHTKSVKIVWKKKYTTKERETIVNNVYNDREAIERFIRIKGNFDKITFISIQDYDRETLSLVDDAILADDKEGILYQMKEEWKASQSESTTE